jgi:hypothetical protein
MAGCGFGQWIYDYQTLIARALAIGAAVIALGGQLFVQKRSEDGARARDAQTGVAIVHASAHELMAALAILTEGIRLRQVEQDVGIEAPMTALEARIAHAEIACREARTAMRAVDPATCAPFILNAIVPVESAAVRSRDVVEVWKSPACQKLNIRQALATLEGLCNTALESVTRFANDPARLTH